MTDLPLWTPTADRIAGVQLTAFAKAWGKADLAAAADYRGLHAASIEDPGGFWAAVWDFCGIVGDKGEGPLVTDGDRMPGARFFLAARLNFAENLLRKSGSGDALVFWGEDKVRRRMSWSDLRGSVGRAQRALKALG